MFKFFKNRLDLARDAYEACHDHRRSQLAEFRKSASREILLTYPDAKVLSNLGCDTFLAFSKESNVIINGDFADSIFPRVNHVGSREADSGLFEEAASIYRSKCEQFLSSGHPDRRATENYDLHGRMNPDVRTDFLKKGYTIYGEADSDLLIAVEITLDELKIASSNCVSPKKTGYFTKKIYNEVAFNNITNELGISTLTLELTEFSYGSSSSYYHHITYDNRLSFAGESGFKSFNAIFSGLLAFISAIEDEVRSMPRELAEEPEAEWEEFLRRSFDAH